MARNGKVKQGTNGKSHLTSKQLQAAVAAQEMKCNKVFKEYFTRLEGKLDKLTETLGYVNTMLSERLSNHSARLESAESAIGQLKKKVSNAIASAGAHSSGT